MKVFISHSTRDKWLARRIAADLEELAVKCFLDEKDIKTGDSIDESIQEHLRDCDDFLILLSPASVDSHWVLIELGGAIALGKRLVPILLYVGANEIPKPITKHLARDIADIGKYYDEVRDQLSQPKGATKKKTASRRPKKTTTKTAKKQSARPRSFPVGTRVKIADRPQSTREEIGWDGRMNDYCGKVAKITQADTDRTYRLDIDEGASWWAHEWLRLHK